jgi:uncharacterized membrane protein YfcA
VDPVLILAGLGVGIVVGLTGMGGGALMTPLLVLVFGVPPLAAVSSDLAASAVMKPFGGWVHARRGTVNWSLVRWLCLGSVPSAFCGVLLTRLIPGQAAVQEYVQYALGIALLLAATGLVAKAVAGRARAEPASTIATEPPLRPRPLPTVLLGMGGGLVVGLTSVGSGSLIIVILLALYPRLRPNSLVGTDLVQAVPLVAAAAFGHLFFGDLHFDLAGAILIGSVPGVLLGARLSSRAPAGIVRAGLVVVLLASGLKLFGVPNPVLATVAAALIAIGVLVAVSNRLTLRSPVDAGQPEPIRESDVTPGRSRTGPGPG